MTIDFKSKLKERMVDGVERDVKWFADCMAIHLRKFDVRDDDPNHLLCGILSSLGIVSNLIDNNPSELTAFLKNSLSARFSRVDIRNLHEGDIGAVIDNLTECANYCLALAGDVANRSES